MILLYASSYLEACDGPIMNTLPFSCTLIPLKTSMIVGTSLHPLFHLFLVLLVDRPEEDLAVVVPSNVESLLFLIFYFDFAHDVFVICIRYNQYE